MKSLCFVSTGLVGLALFLAPVQAQECSTDADCTAPLTCKSLGATCTQSGSALPDGGMSVSDPVCVPEPSRCTWTLVACTADSQCTQARWACLPLPSAGADKICFPQGIICAAGQACPAGWSCVDFAAVAEKDLVDMWNPNGETKYCFPDFLRGVADKTTQVDSSGINPGEVGGAGTGGPVRGAADAGSAAGAGAGPADKPSSSGCAIGGHAHTAWPCCLLAGLLAIRQLRKRREGVSDTPSHHDRRTDEVRQTGCMTTTPCTPDRRAWRWRASGDLA
jgi:hypothetical protein